MNNKQGKEYKPERLQSIRRYFETRPASFQIDDRTWTDLELDRFFQKIDTTVSASGEEFLYYLLRTPLFQIEELEKREQQISYVYHQAEEREKLLSLLKQIGNTGKYSVYDYLNYLDRLEDRKSTRHYVAIFLVLISVCSCFLSFPVGLALLVLSFIYNIVTYFKVKGEIDPYITCFTYVLKVLRVVPKLLKEKNEAFEEEYESLRRNEKALSRFRRGAFLLMPSNPSLSSNLFDMVFDYIRMIFHVDLLQFNKMLHEIRKYAKEIDEILTVIGKLDAYIAVASYRESGVTYCIPTWRKDTEKRSIITFGIACPLLEEAVENDLTATGNILLTGSNASGKSTFLRTIGMNAILAQTIHTCIGKSYEACLFRVYTSISIRDHLELGESYYIAEIKSLQRILNAVSDKELPPVLCIVDEILRGTNTAERIAAGTEILKSLSEKNCLCFAATHDIELTYLLAESYRNLHFEEEIEKEDIFFSYKIKEGRAESRNAIRLLKMMGYSPEVVEKANERLERFLESGKWS